MWEQWFQTNSVTAVRDQLKTFNQTLDEEQLAVNNMVGSKYPELLALAHRLASLCDLTNQVEPRLMLTAEPSLNPQIRSLAPSIAKTLPLIRLKLAKMLTSLANRQLVQNQLKACAQTVYLGRVMNFVNNNREFSAVAASLDLKLQSWLVNESQLPQFVYLASLISWECTPAKFLSKFLTLRSIHHEKLLRSSVDLALKSVDHTMFIYEQVVGDLCQAKLPNRRLIDLPEFKIIGVAQNLQWIVSNAYSTDDSLSLTSFRAFPDKCYLSEPISELITGFLSDFCEKFSKSSLFVSASSAKLVSMLSLVIQQTQSALGGEKYQTSLLTLLLPIFIDQLLKKMSQELTMVPDLLPEPVINLRQDLQKLAKLSIPLRYLQSKLADPLEQAVSQGENLITTKIAHNYDAQFTKLVSFSPNSSLAELASQVHQLQQFNCAYQQLGGQVRAIPPSLYELVGHKLTSYPLPSRVYFGDPIIPLVLERQRLMDEHGISFWESGVDIVREVVLKDLHGASKLDTTPVCSSEESVLPSKEHARSSDEPVNSPEESALPSKEHVSSSEESVNSPEESALPSKEHVSSSEESVNSPKESVHSSEERTNLSEEPAHTPKEHHAPELKLTTRSSLLLNPLLSA